MKPLKFVGASLDDLRNFPDEARRAAGFELRAIQNGLEPNDWKSIYTLCMLFRRKAVRPADRTSSLPVHDTYRSEVDHEEGYS